MKNILTFKIQNASKNIEKCLSHMIPLVSTTYKKPFSQIGL